MPASCSRPRMREAWQFLAALGGKGGVAFRIGSANRTDARSEPQPIGERPQSIGSSSGADGVAWPPPSEARRTPLRRHRRGGIACAACGDRLVLRRLHAFALGRILPKVRTASDLMPECSVLAVKTRSTTFPQPTHRHAQTLVNRPRLSFVYLVQKTLRFFRLFLTKMRIHV